MYNVVGFLILQADYRAPHKHNESLYYLRLILSINTGPKLQIKNYAPNMLNNPYHSPYTYMYITVLHASWYCTSS